MRHVWPLGLALLAGAVTGSALIAVPAAAVSGGAPAADGSYGFVAKIVMDGRACTGALINREWAITAASCFPENPQGGTPARATTVTVGRTNLAGTTGHVARVRNLVVRTDRNLALAQLDTLIPDVTPIPLATALPETGASVRVAGYGRTATEWVPDQLRTAAFSVASTAATTLAITGDNGVDTCKGDAGGPAFTETGGQPQLVGISSTSWHHGCLAVTETRQGSTETRVDDLADWIRQITYATDISLTGNRVARVQNGSAYLKDGDAAWSLQWEGHGSPVTKVRVDGSRVGVLLANGDLWVKDDAVPGLGWLSEHDAITDFALSGQRIAVVGNGIVYLKDGNLQGNWTTPWEGQGGPVTKVRVDGSRIGVLVTGNVVWVRDDAEPALGWTAEADATTAFDLAGNRIGIVQAGQCLVKIGNLQGTWTDLGQ